MYNVICLPMLRVTCTICIEELVTLVAVTVLMDMLCGERKEREREGEGGSE